MNENEQGTQEGTPQGKGAASNPAVETKGLWKTFGEGDTAVHAIQNVSLTIQPGEFAALCGPSGSGKTTLVNLVGGLTDPTRGEVRVDGREVGAMSERQRAQLRLERIGFVFQAYNLLPVLTAMENAEFPLMLRGVDREERRKEVSALFEHIGLGGLEDRRPGALSGGQQQRVAVARAVLGAPALVLADEPTANLDTHASDALLGVMETLNAERGVTFIFCTHDPRVMRRARRIIRLVDGHVERDAEKETGELPEWVLEPVGT
jgi:putative ABC transport system ATP-binding protein